MRPDEQQNAGDLRPEELEAWIQQAEQIGFLEEGDALSSPDASGPIVQPGDVIGGFRIVEPIGSGGRSDVYRAHQLSVADRDVALKVYSDLEDNSSPAEVQALASLEHPNLARVIDAGFTPPGHRYVAMALLSGVPIDRYCDGHQLSNRQVAMLFRKVCSAVDVLHQRGIVHCDLKPNNILVDDGGEPVVTDFDASQHRGYTDPLRRGTVGYVAPELLAATSHLPVQSSDSNTVSNYRADTAADIYGLGAVLYRCLAGERLFAGGSASGALMATLFDPPPPLRSVCAATDPDLESICVRCLRKSPGERYPTVAALVADLDAYLDSPIIADTKKFRRTALFAAALAMSFGMVLLLLLACGGRPSWLRPDSDGPSVDQSAMPGLLPPTVGTTDTWQLETRDPRPGFLQAQLSPAKDRIAVMGNDSWLRIYAIEGSTLSLMTMLSMDHPTHTTQRAMSWHPDGDRLVAAAGDNCAIIWSVERSQSLARLSPGGTFNLVRDAQWSPDGQAIAVACRSGLVQLYDAAGTLAGDFRGHQGEALRVRWSPNGRRIISGDVSGVVQVWDSASFEVEHVLGEHQGGAWSPLSIRAIKWCPDGERFAVGNEGGDVIVFDCETGQAATLGNLGSPVSSLEWSGDGRLFAGCNHLAVYSAGTGWNVIEDVVDGLFESLEWDAQRSRLFTAGRRGQLELWNMDQETYDVLGQSNASTVRDLEWSYDGTLLASAGADGVVRLFDQSGNVLAVTAQFMPTAGIRCLSWHPTQLLFACGSGEGGQGVDIYKVALAGESTRRDRPTVAENGMNPLSEGLAGGQVTAERLTYIPLNAVVQAIVWSPTGDHLIVGDSFGSLRVIVANDWREVATSGRHNAPIESLDVSSDQRVVSADTSGQLWMWELSDSGQLRAIDGHSIEHGVGDIAFDQTGERLAVTDRYLEVFLLDGHTFADLWKRSVVAPARPGKLAWSQDSRNIACGNFGMLDALTGRLVDSVACNYGGCVAWHPQGLIVTGNWQGEIEFRAAPDFELQSRSLQLAGGVTVTLPATDGVPESLKRPPPYLRWVHQPLPGRYLARPKRGD